MESVDRSLARRLVAAALAVALAAPAWAQMGREQAAAAAERQSGGRVLAVDRTESRGTPMWRVKVITPRGEVRVLLFEADDGRAARSPQRADDAGDARSGADTGSRRADRPNERNRARRND